MSDIQKCDWHECTETNPHYHMSMICDPKNWEPLGEEFEKVYWDNRWELYDE